MRAQIEEKILALEYEKRIGKREIDAIDKDISLYRNEIVSLRRKYLNTFYFF